MLLSHCPVHVEMLTLALHVLYICVLAKLLKGFSMNNIAGVGLQLVSPVMKENKY